MKKEKQKREKFSVENHNLCVLFSQPTTTQQQTNQGETHDASMLKEQGMKANEREKKNCGKIEREREREATTTIYETN